jgi:outer membrane protein W
MRRLITSGLVALAVLGVFGAGAASAQQQLVISLGGFSPRAQDARSSGDVLVGDRQFLDFNIGDLSGPAIGGEWLVNLGDNFEAGLGIGFYQRSTPAVDRLSSFSNGDPIVADLKLRVIPFSATVRYLPIGHHGPVQPYIGGGVGVFNYRYSETGDFVSSDNVSIINGSFVGSGTATGPVILGGVRIPVGAWGVGGEIRYQSATGNLPSDQGFAGGPSPRIDLGGITYTFTINVRF